MKALSFKQPWAWLVCIGLKDVDNRTWLLRMPPLLPYPYPAPPKRIYVHASKTFDREGYHWVQRNFPHINWGDYWTTAPLSLGAIIGEVDITACFNSAFIGYPKINSPWYWSGYYGLVLNDPVLYEKPIPCKGRQRFFEVPK